MLLQRALVTFLLLPIGIALIVIGGWAYSAFIALILGLAAIEYNKLFRTGGLQPASLLVIGGVLLLALGRAWNGFASAPLLISILVLLSLAYHLIDYERGRDHAGTDFGVTLGGIFYLGWIGAYMISLRTLPEGLGWILIVLPAVWLADMGAYLIGTRFGRHKLSPRLSPKKTWEGYLGGILVGILGTPLVAAAWQAFAIPGTAITPWRGVLIGLVMGVLPTLGDLGESMIKRQVGAKDSGKLLPGHGGAFDRIDSWLWAAVVGYYLITWLWI
jgi:phosphatidate cytidylyltransferase